MKRINEIDKGEDLSFRQIVYHCILKETYP